MHRPNLKHGQSLVEFALIATLLITLLLGIVDFGRAYYTQVTIKNAVADGGYFAIQNTTLDSIDDPAIRAVIKRQLGHLDPPLADSQIAIERTCVSGAGKTKIRVEYDYQLLFSFIIANASVKLGDETIVPKISACS